MNLIQNEDNKCPTTKQVNDALKSMGGGGGGVQTLVLTTPNLLDSARGSTLEVNSTDQKVMDIVKSNMTNLEPFQLLYCGKTELLSIYAPMTVVGIPSNNVFTFYVNVSGAGAHHFGINKSGQKWIASTLGT